MKKITLSVFLMTSLIFNSFGQEKKILNTKNNSIQTKTLKQNNNTSSLQLNRANQDFYNETGVIRCYTDEYNEQLRQNNPNRRSSEEFENWLAPLVNQYKSRVAQEKADGTYRRAVVLIPIIFHVVSENSAANDPVNLSAAIVNAQIDQLNLDFRNLAGAASGPWSDRDGDAMIEFVPAQVDPMGNQLAEPGINRISGYAGAISTATWNNTIKPATVWDRTKYCNNWTGQLEAGLLGYAQFPEGSGLPGVPGGGTEFTDGVVNSYASIGSIANPNPAGGQFASGRTLTHELGHWIGLRHLWGEDGTGGCDSDDYVDDTPNQASPNNGGCATTSDSCTEAGRDMVENYMDYSGDACMNIFTEDQVARIMTVLANSPGRSELPNSTTGNVAPTVTFVNTTQNSSEGTDCSYTDITINLSVGAFAPTQNAVATLSVNTGSSTATSASDYLLMNNTVTFAQGATANQTTTLRIFNDGFVEGDETVSLTFSLNANGGDAIIGNNNMVFTINDDDSDIIAQVSQDVFVNTGDATDWTIIDANGGNTYGIFGGGVDVPGVMEPDFFGSRAEDDDNGTANPNDDITDTDDYLISPAFTIPNSATSISIEHALFSANGSQNFELYFSTSTNNVAEVQSGTLIANGNATDFTGANTLETINLTVAQVNAIKGQTGSLVLRHQMATNDDGYLLWDTITVNAIADAFIQTAVNNNITEQYSTTLSESGTISARNITNDFVMTTIANNTSFDYGCVNVSVNRAGTSAQSYNGSTGNNLVFDKTFQITTGNQTSTGNNTIDFYVTNAEISGWIAQTGLTANDIFAYREGSNDVIALTASAFGPDNKLTGTFTGLNGTYYLGAEGAFRTRLSPKMYLSGVTISGGLMNDNLRANNYLPITSPYTDALTVNASVFTATGADAIVDWVWVELRDETTNTTITASKSALLQRDGDVVDLDGTSALTLITPGKSFYVAVNHRNHLGTMSKIPIALSATPVVVDFTSSIVTFGTNAQRDMGAGVLGLWAGDSSGNGQVRFLGPGNDLNNLKAFILSDAGNTTGSSSFPVNGYSNADINLNGQARFLGPGNDNNILKSIILANPANTAGSTSYPLSQQIPQ